jgi:2-desacetyl-2-hydroxyethyl bacteriochlorophyllide A dehydrogenase
MKTRAVSFEAPGRVGHVDVDVPARADDEVLVRTLYSGISTGTELLAYRGEVDPQLPLDETIGALGGTFTYPFRYGYGCVGRVEESAGPEQREALVFAFHPHQERFVVPWRDVVPLPSVDPRTATLFPLLETAFQACLDAGQVYADPVVVLGLGPLGLLTAALLERAGARVIGVEPRQWRREAAAAFGVEAVSPPDVADAVTKQSEGRGVPLLVEASGRPEALASGLSLLAHEGTALVISWYGTKEVSLPLGAEFHRRRLTLRSTQVSSIPAAMANRWSVPRRRAAVRELLTTLPLSALATHAFPFERAADAYAALDRGDEGLVHAALCYG